MNVFIVIFFLPYLKIAISHKRSCSNIKVLRSKVYLFRLTTNNIHYDIIMSKLDTTIKLSILNIINVVGFNNRQIIFY